MEQITLSKQNIIDSLGSSSKGNQPKWYHNDVWYKADFMGYEGLVEVVISRLLQHSNVTNYVQYYPAQLLIDKNKKMGCYSGNFRNENLEIFSLERLYMSYNGISLAKALSQYDNTENKIKYTVDFIKQTTELNNVESYLTTMIELDAFFLNEDRHTNNIAFFRDKTTKKFSFCPYFDFGLSLLSDLNDYPIENDLYKSIDNVKAKPFDTGFDTQLDAVYNLYGNYVNFDFNSNDICNVFKEFSQYYSEDIINRVKNIVFYQKHRYSHMFSK